MKKKLPKWALFKFGVFSVENNIFPFPVLILSFSMDSFPLNDSV
ncbi:hypothetical protein MgSA37_02259 [Mucilaginibacter gotjawali]|uniref:Uncharacterized protein n=2 Tax=Mucilaginibacter gotjawali TaxID=1550579 RepID=A0A120MYV2_9SPHI|nr:hypothetical protein [Mucilaginibacter gotjawali]BAU54088.1 hypothetical protein MgSA37_02259 [Mucilaginibacter gotjawali]